jgi:predicted phage-related endonuclease
VRRSGVRERLLQIKTSDAHEAWRWGEGPDDIPPAYLIQEQWEMFVTGLPIADLAVLIGGNRYREYTITADADLQANLLEIAERWWADYGCNPERHPPLDASPAAAEYLKRRFPQALAPMLDADAEAIELAHQLQVADAELKQVHARVELLENRLKEKIGDAEGLTGPDFRLTWRVVPRKGYEVKPSSSRQFRAKFLDVA